MRTLSKVLLSAAVLSGLALSSNAVLAATLDGAEKTHLVFMREEEKLARDVYITLGNMYPTATVFASIDDSEQQHTTTVKSKLTKYGLPDPSTSDAVGMFTGVDYGAYFTEKYNHLVTDGSNSELDALYAGAFIEELDMHDIVECPQAIMALKGYPEGGCGMNYTDVTDLKNMYNSLVEGSKNHLRAYVGQIEAVTGVPYVAQYLPQATVNQILGR